METNIPKHMPVSMPQTLETIAPNSLRLNGLHPELLKCLKNDASVISKYLDKYPTAWGGLKLAKCGLIPRLRRLYSAIIQPYYYQTRHLIPGFNIHWNIDSSKMSERIKENVNQEDWDRLRNINAMTLKNKNVYSLNGECKQLNFAQWFKATFEDQRKIVDDIVNIFSTNHRELLGSSGTNLSFSISELERELPKLARKKILHVLKSQNDIFSNGSHQTIINHDKLKSHQSLSEEKWSLICKIETVQDKLKLTPQTKHSYVSELEEKKKGSVKKYKLDHIRRDRNYLAFNKSWRDHVEFYKYFTELEIPTEKSVTYNNYIVYLMNLVWQYFSEEAMDLHDTRPPFIRRRFKGVGGNGRAWHYLVVARAITKLNPKQRESFFEIKSTDEKFDKKFNNGKSEERWNDFMSNFPNRSLKASVSRDLICSKKDCNSIEMELERGLFHCKICGTVNNYNFDTDEYEDISQYGAQGYINMQHKYTHLQQFSREGKIGKWKKYLSRNQKEFLNNLSCNILMNAEDEVKGLMKLAQQLNREPEMDMSSEDEVKTTEQVQKSSAESIMDKSSVDYPERVQEESPPNIFTFSKKADS